jgi:hypothetical protein
MRARAAAIACIAVGCGDNSRPPPDAAGPPPPPPCVATFAGNFAETVELAPGCAMVSTGGTIALALPSMVLATTDAISIDLGAPPTIGNFSSETVRSWSAQATVQHGSDVCIYLAGSSAVPAGSFTMAISELDDARHTAHGTLVVQQNVLAGAETSCGAGSVEQVTVDF